MATPTALRAQIRRRDPYRVALRRASRVAITVPISLIVLLRVEWLGATALFGVFGTLALLVFADFGGALRQRFIAYVLTVLAGMPILVVGVIAGPSLWGSMAWMGIVTLALGVAGVLRGSLASAQTTLLLACVLAVTSSRPGTEAQTCVAWLIGGTFATVAAIALWPARPRQELRGRLATVYDTAAETLRKRWIDTDDSGAQAALAELEHLLAELHGVYDGNLMRPSGLTNSDRALAELVDIAGRLVSYQHWLGSRPAIAHDQELLAANATFARTLAGQLREVAKGLRGDHNERSPDLVLAARQRHLTEVSEWVDRHADELSSPDIRRRLDDLFPLRLTSASVELAAATGKAHWDFEDKTLGDLLDQPRRGGWDRILAQTSWDSPWFRNALRSAVALAISVGFAKTLALGHEFWIVLGTLTALRFDALGTGRTAWQALLGTSIGVALASVLIVLFQGDTTVWWVLLPISLFIAAYTPGTFSLIPGQAGFSLCVLVLFSLLFPTTLAVAELRVIDVAIGLAISLLISLIMWPRGVVVKLYARMRDAMNGATDHLVVTIDYMAGGAVDDQIRSEFSQRAAHAIDRAQEAFDLSVAQKPPETVPLRAWSRLSNSARHIDVNAHMLPGTTQALVDRGAERAVPAELVGPMLDASNDLRRRLRHAVKQWDAVSMTSTDPEDATALAEPDTTPVTLSPHVREFRAAITRWMDSPGPWEGVETDPRPAMMTWLSDWMAFVDWNAEMLARHMPASAPPSPS